MKHHTRSRMRSEGPNGENMKANVQNLVTGLPVSQVLAIVAVVALLIAVLAPVFSPA